MPSAPLFDRVPRGDATGEALLDAFVDYATEAGFALYPAQEEALLEVLSGANVILNTPTGSGKSLVAKAAHFRSLALGERSFYTAPIKALVNEKFFDLCQDFGAEQVGLMTGDAAVNRDAPIVCCTAEILANLALREGAAADVDHAVVDEFHFYADRERGVAWQVPLLELERTTFLLMSATLGDTTFFERALTELNGKPTALVRSTDRPVPLDFTYSETPIHETIADLLEGGKAPVYIVHFTQRAAAEQAQNLMSIDFLSKEDKNAIKGELAGFRFDSPYGKDLRRFVLHGVGVHHAGVLPKYRRLVERLAQTGLLKVICGTDTLGVGVNIPIRTVLLTQLCKFDGEKTRVLSAREFHQISGRAGRKGFDSEGSVVVQAPEHAIENRSAEHKAVGDAKKLRKLARKKPPTRGYAHWDEATYERIRAAEPEPLQSSFAVTHAMLVQLLQRPGDGCAAIRALLRKSHERHVPKRRHGRRAIALFRSLLEAEIVEVLDVPDAKDRLVHVHADLQDDFSLNQALSLWVVDTLGALDLESPEHALDVLTLVEAVLENPRVVLLRQLDKLKDETIAVLKAEGVEYDARMAELDKLEYPKPHRDFIYEQFNLFAKRQPWVGDNIRPKSIARDMYERAATFREYVKEYGLQRSEGVLLRYLSNAYKALLQTVPEADKTDEVWELCDFLGAVVRQADSSLLDEWEQLRDGVKVPEEVEARPPEPVNITTDEHGFTVLVRNEVFRFVRFVARRQYDRAAAMVESVPGEPAWSPARIAESLEGYFAEYDEIGIDPRARSPRLFVVDKPDDPWRVTQTLADPEANHDWFVELHVDLARSAEENRPVLRLIRIAN